MILLAVITSALLTFSTLPIIIRLFKAINLTDDPDTRKIHLDSTPSLGGLSIYFSVLLAVVITVPLATLVDHRYFLGAIIISLVLGVRDDISSLNSDQKIVVQILASFIVVYFGGVRLTGFYGLFGIGEINYYLSVGMSVFLLVALTNSFNLIDGIDGLAGSISLLICLFLGLWFWQSGNTFYSILSFSISGGMLSFLFFNWEPSKIFMGDTGSLVTGFVITCLLFTFINEGNMIAPNREWMSFEGVIGMSLALIILPIYDTLRVFILRISTGKSPFQADRQHVHHVLLRQGFTHSQATIILIFFNISAITLTMLFNSMGDFLLILMLTLISATFGKLCDIRLKKYLSQKDMFRSLTKGQAIPSK